MLNHSKLLKKILNASGDFFEAADHKLDIALQTWQKVIEDQDFLQKVKEAKDVPWGLPTWSGSLGSKQLLTANKQDYTAISVDGSQVYPDRHSGTKAYLINCGTAILRYNKNSSASFASEPYVFANTDDFEFGSDADIVDCQRHRQEMIDGLKIAQKESEQDIPVVYMMDGSLITWHLENQNSLFWDLFGPDYLKILDSFYKQQIPIIGYISLPNSKEIISLLRLQLCDFDSKNENYKIIDGVNDADLMAAVLQPGQVTPWLRSNVAAVNNYPNHLRPYFLYFNSGNEIARIEVPAWLIKDINKLKFVMQVVADQADKGFGYPVCLTEAHQQAVIKTFDKKFFYYTLDKVGEKENHKAKSSQKKKHKQVIGI